jgi:hypothetical protein
MRKANISWVHTPRVSLLNPEHELLLVILCTWDIEHNISVFVAQFANGFLLMCKRSPTGPSRPLARSLSAPSVASEEHINQEHKHDGNTEHQAVALVYSNTSIVVQQSHRDDREQQSAMCLIWNF